MVTEKEKGADHGGRSGNPEGIDTPFFPVKGGVFISSIVVAQKYQGRSRAALALRLALVEDLIREWPDQRRTLCISAQALSPK
jgi:hypothetical protein